VLHDLGVRPEGARPPLGAYRIEIDGELHAFPGTPATFLRSTALGGRAKAQLVRFFATLPLVKAARLGGQSTEDWLRGLDLRPDAERILRVLLRTATYCVDFGALSADAAVSQLQLAVTPGVLYLHDGWGPMVAGLVRQVEVVQHKALRIEPVPNRFLVHTDAGQLTASSVVIAVGGPEATDRLLPEPPPWPELAASVTAACLDVGVRGIPSPGYVMGTTAHVYATTQGPPARQAPPGDAVLAVGKYTAGAADEDRQLLDRYLRLAGAVPDDIVVQRFLPRMTVTGPPPTPATGGYDGRPREDATGIEGLYIAGDWVGARGLLADASLASGQAAGLLARTHVERSATMVS
jgi:hypothetical protein